VRAIHGRLQSEIRGIEEEVEIGAILNQTPNNGFGIPYVGFGKSICKEF
jgi:hypothetical protein